MSNSTAKSSDLDPPRSNYTTSNSTTQSSEPDPASLTQQIFDAVAGDDLRALKTCVKKKRIPLTGRDHDNNTAAHIAAKDGKYMLLNYMLNKCPSLLNETDAAGKTVLHLSVATDQPKILKLLFEKYNADLNARCSSPSGNTVVHEAVEQGAIRVLQYLHKGKKADLEVRNRRGQSPIFLAANRDRESVFRYLLDYGSVDPTVKDDEGEDIVFTMVCNGTIKLFSYLCKNKGIYYDVNLRNRRGECALHRAVQCDRLDFVRHLVEMRSAVHDVADNEGRTPLYEAARIGRVDVVRYLLSKGAQVNCWTTNHTKPADVATNPEVLECLKAAELRTEHQVRVRRRRAVWSADPFNVPSVRNGHRMESYPALSSTVDLRPLSSIALPQVDAFLTLANTFIRYVLRT